MKFMGSLLLSILSLFSHPVYANADELKKLLAPISTLNAEFQQRVMSEKGQILQVSKGKVWLKKPGQFRWEIEGADAHLVIADGKNVWDFDKELEQVTIQKLNKNSTQTPIFFLTGNVDRLEVDFKVKTIHAQKMGCVHSDQCFELKPKGEEGAFQWIKVGFKGQHLKELIMLDHLGQESQFVFKNVKLNENIPSGVFHFTVPKGVDVLNQE